MKTDMTDDIGLLAETDKPTKAPWFLRMPGAILRKNGSDRTSVGADQDGLLARTVKGVVSLVQNLLPSPTQKKEVSAAAAVLAGIGLLCAPVESTQAQTGIPEVTELVITTFAALDYELRHGWVSFPLLDFTGADSSWFQDPYRPRQGSLEGNPSEYEGYFYWAFSVDFNRQRILIEYYVQTGPNVFILAWVIDNAGNEYTVPVTIIYAGIQD